MTIAHAFIDEDHHAIFLVRNTTHGIERGELRHRIGGTGESPDTLPGTVSGVILLTDAAAHLQMVDGNEEGPLPRLVKDSDINCAPLVCCFTIGCLFDSGLGQCP